MPNIQQIEQPKDNEPQKRKAFSDLIRKQIMDVLGQPLDLLKVQVRPIWADRYRVNVVVGKNAGSAKVSNSFFIIADSTGSLISSTPSITKQY